MKATEVRKGIHFEWKRKANQKAKGLDEGRDVDSIFGNQQRVGFWSLSDRVCGYCGLHAQKKTR